YLRHFRLLRQEFLDLARIDVEAARYDQVAPPPAQRVIPVRGPPASIARPEPSVRERCPRRLNLPPIPMENVAPAQPHFTFFLAHYVAPIIVHNPHLNARQWQPDGPRAALPFIWIRNVHQRLVQPIPSQNPVPNHSANPLKYWPRQGRRSRNKEPHPCTNLARRLSRRFQQPYIHRWHTKE